MLVTRLKNYPKYLEKIYSYAESVCIKIIVREEDGDGCYNHFNSCLYIDPDLEEASEIATLLHELGHAFDYHLVDKKLSPKIWHAYEKVYSEDANLNDKELQTVMDAEIRAWENGKVIAKRLKIPLGKWYAHERKISLMNYRRS
jgi:hypothetical protein